MLKPVLLEAATSGVGMLELACRDVETGDGEAATALGSDLRLLGEEGQHSRLVSAGRAGRCNCCDEYQRRLPRAPGYNTELAEAHGSCAAHGD